MSLTRRAFDLVGTAAMGVAKGGIDFTAGATAAAVKGGIVIGKPLAKGAGKVAEGVGGAAIDFFGGAGESAVTALSTPESRKAVAQTWGKIFNGVSNAFVKTANNGSLTTENVIIVPSNTGLYLEGAEGTYDLEVVPAAYAGSTDVSANMLVAGTGAKVPQTDGSGNTNFILTTNKGASATPKFFKVNTDGNTVAVGKAYLQIPSENVGAHEYFWFEDETTGIEAAKAAQKMNGEFFNLAGQRVAQPTKGLYIVNGKKVIFK